MKKEDLIRNLKAELLKLEESKKTYDTFETRYDIMIKDVLDYVEDSTPNEIIRAEIKEIEESKKSKGYISIYSSGALEKLQSLIGEKNKNE